MTTTPTDSEDNKSSSWELRMGDCIEVLRTIPAEHVDAVVTDPPYMIWPSSTYKTRSWADMMNASLWYREWMRECWRTIKPSGFLVAFTNWRTVPVILKACADASIPPTSLAVWDKECLSMAGPSQLRSSYEMILFCARTPSAKIHNRRRSDVFRYHWRASYAGDSRHPAQKPVPLLKELVELVTQPGGLVMDPFAGSGTTGVAAIQAGRKFLGIEANETYYVMARDRLSCESSAV